ncbi:MAG: mechanosensitive ion channel family protein [Patescibacteria group bacterium]|nr:mechanosensitive ion channel family protein [Patescibacteria group bacterium]
MTFDIALFQNAFVSWGTDHGVSIVAIVVITFVAQWVLGAVLARVIRRLVPAKHFRSKDAEKKREDTLIRITRGTLGTLIWVVAFLMVLSEAGLDIGPLLAAAGVAGLAIGFGGQYLIRDTVAGLFIILENQYRVGDVVCLDDTCGLVEDVSIRMATLRDLDGTVHHVSHGTVNKVSNLSKEFARVNLNVGVAYDSDLEKVISVVNAVGEDLSADPAWKDDIIKPVKFERVDDFADSSIIVKVLGDTMPLRQWAVAGEYRKRLKIAFDKAGIEIPFPQRVIHTKG